MRDQEEIHKQCLSENPKERICALNQLRDNFPSLVDKQQAWEDLYKLIEDEDNYVRSEATNALRLVFYHVSDKQQAWKDLIELINDCENDVLSNIVHALGSIFSQLPDKQQAWSYLHRLTYDQSDIVRSSVADTLGYAFSHLPDKQQAWEDIRKLTEDEDNYVRYRAAEAIGSVFSYVSDKQQAWNNLHRLSNDEECWVRCAVACVLRSTYSQLPDKQQAWNDLHRLANDQEFWVRYWTSESLGSMFSELPDKQQAWSDLIKLAQDEDDSVRCHTVFRLGSACSHLADKQQAWNDLHRLTNDQDSWVRLNAAEALGHIFSDVPDKYQVFKDLIKLNKDEDVWVRIYANYSLGKVCIFDASQAENEKDYKSELENAIEFFEKASRESSFSSLIKFNKVSQIGNCSVSYDWGTPSQFCLPFYRSFHTIIFKKRDAKEEVDKYLEEAKSAIEGSKSKELLFEAVENLASALNEVQNLEKLDLEAKKGELKFYRQYCDRASELMIEIEESAPFATIAMRKGLPILDRNLKEPLEEIQKKTEVIREQTKGTPFEKLGNDLNEGSVSLLQVRDLVGFKKQVQNLENKFSSMCSKLPEGQKGEACELLKTIHEEHSIEDKIPLINDILSKFSYQLDMITCLNRIDASLSSVNKKVDELIIFSRLGISEEVVISTGFQLAGSGFQHSIIIPLQEISYAELQEDLKQIRGKTIDKLSKLPKRLANKVKDYLLLYDKDDILEKLT